MKSRVAQTHLNLIIALVAVAAIGVISISLGWYYILGVADSSNKLSTEATTITDKASALSTLKIRLLKVASQKNLVYETIPATKEVSTFLATAEDLARKQGVKINSETVGDTQSKVKSGSDFSQTVNKQQYYQLPIKYDVSGDYSSVQALMADIAASRRLASLINPTITADYSDASKPSRVRATFTVNIYSKK